MACKKYKLINTGTTLANFTYQRCDDAMWEYQVGLEINQIKNIWLIENTYSTAFSPQIVILESENFPFFQITQTPTSSNNFTNTPTPTNTLTPTNTPSLTPTNTQTPTPTETEQIITDAILTNDGDYIEVSNNQYLMFIDPTPNPTPTQTPTNTGTQTPTPTMTPTTTETPTQTPTTTETPTQTQTNTETTTPTQTPTNTETPTQTPTNTPSSTPLPFESVWRTTTPNESITLPLVSSGNYNFTVNWGDGNTDNITTWNQAETTHTYSTANDYTVTINGTLSGFSFNDWLFTDNPYKIISVTRWGILKLGNVTNNFQLCENLDLSSVTDTLNLQGKTNMGGMFALCTSLTSINNINNWDTSNVTNMAGVFSDCSNLQCNISNWNTSGVTNMATMFYNCNLFNSNISNWDVSNVLYMSGLFYNASVFNQNISNWNVSNVLLMDQMFDAAHAFNQNISNWNTSGATNMDRMFRNALSFNQDLSPWCVDQIPTTPTDFATGASSWVLPKPIWGTCSNPFTSIWRTTSPNETIYLPIYDGGNYNFSVNWGDGNIETITSYSGNSHTYSSPGNHTVTIRGIIEGWSFYNVNNSPSNLIEITEWGCLKFLDAEGYFYDCANLVLTGVTDVPNLDGVSSMITMFFNCSSLTTVNNMNSWNVSGVTNMFLMFANTTLFNQDISNWDVSSVFNFSGMFQNTNEFNQPIGGWNVSSVFSMNGMFANAISFNRDLSGWCVTLIPSLPAGFDTGATSWTLPKPVWGTCPP